MMSAQLVSILVMFISGIAVGVVIDLVRTTLQTLGIHRIAFLVEWLIWLVLGVCTFVLLFFVKGGQWRVIDPMAQIAGIFVYALLFQRIFRLIGRVLVNSIIKPIYFVGYLVVHIIRKIIIIFVKVLVFLFHPIYIFFYKKMENIFQKKR